ncbi:MAG TPA: metallophosphoesterase family protein [Ktedonobacteraceae bacterium]|nr:metallophosphoesterase family protein [Ktedonobacteraceae bacterium]
MKIVALYDIHSNLPALDAVLQEVKQERPDLILIGGDMVPGPMPRAVLERLLDLGEAVHFLRGNCEREVVAAFDGFPFPPGMSEETREATRWTARQLTRSQRDFLAGLPEQASLSVDGLGEVLFCHGSPRSDEELITAATPEERLRALLVGTRQQVIVCGHTHMQFDRSIDGKRIVNAGSVGMPYGEAGAYWLLLGPEIQLRRTRYDLEEAAARIRASGYPLAQDFAENNVLKPPTEAEAITVFERMAEERA